MKSPSKNPNQPPGRLPSLVARQAAAKKIVGIWRKQMPEPKCELYYETPFQLLISVVLSAQTTDKSVNAAMTKHYKNGFDPETVIKWGQDRLREEIRTIGLAPTKAKNICKLTALLVEGHDSQVPDTREELEALPGVGRKTANVILGELFGHPTLAVDTHVYRVGMRLAWHREKTPEKAEQELLKVLDPKSLPAAHHWLILHGRYTCKAQRPNCAECKITKLCPAVSNFS